MIVSGYLSATIARVFDTYHRPVRRRMPTLFVCFVLVHMNQKHVLTKTPLNVRIVCHWRTAPRLSTTLLPTLLAR